MWWYNIFDLILEKSKSEFSIIWVYVRRSQTNYDYWFIVSQKSENKLKNTESYRINWYGNGIVYLITKLPEPKFSITTMLTSSLAYKI